VLDDILPDAELLTAKDNQQLGKRMLPFASAEGQIKTGQGDRI
jgi:hypothetical protein